MNMPISQTEQQVLLEKRQRLFALWTNNDRASELGPEQAAAPAPTTAPRPQQMPRPTAAKSHSDEVRELLQKFTNPNTDRWALF